MIRGLLGRKIGMTWVFDKDGNVIPVTVVEAGPCTVLGLIDTPSDGKKVKLGFETLPEKRVKKPDLGFFKKAGVSPFRFVKEFASSDNKDYKVGQELKADVFKPGDFVDVRGVSKGKGFQGGMKRWNWTGGPGSHGSMHHRRVGSIGSSADPSRTFRGHHMPGHMGARRVTTQGLRVMGVDIDNNLLLIKGAVPGYNRSLVMVYLSKKKAYQSLDAKKAVVLKSRNPMKHSKASTKGK
jgi:large subunit ribosomal protein L3